MILSWPTNALGSRRTSKQNKTQKYKIMENSFSNSTQSGKRRVGFAFILAAALRSPFADNLGANNTLVFDGTVTYTTANLPGPGNTRQFDIVTRFTTAFLYDPAAGNLLLDFQYSSFNGSSLQWDAVTGNATSS